VGDVERAVLELLEPFGFRVVVHNGYMFLRDKSDRANETLWERSVIVSGGVVELEKWVEDRQQLDSVDLCDPGSLDFVEGWARGG